MTDDVKTELSEMLKRRQGKDRILLNADVKKSKLTRTLSPTKFNFLNCTFYMQSTVQLNVTQKTELDEFVSRHGKWVTIAEPDKLSQANVLLTNNPTRPPASVDFLATVSGAVLANVQFVLSEGKQGCTVHVANATSRKPATHSTRSIFVSRLWKTAHPTLWTVLESACHQSTSRWTLVSWSAITRLWASDDSKCKRLRRPQQYIALVNAKQKQQLLVHIGHSD